MINDFKLSTVHICNLPIQKSTLETVVNEELTDEYLCLADLELSLNSKFRHKQPSYQVNQKIYDTNTEKKNFFQLESNERLLSTGSY